MDLYSVHLSSSHSMEPLAFDDSNALTVYEMIRIGKNT
jgi:hypothetical protein